MNMTRHRLHSIGWVFVLSICIAFTVVLTLRVNAVKGQVREAESRILSLRRDIMALDVEFQTRANQRQLASLNAIEFGYVAPGAGQYIEGERQLAALGMPRGPGAPRPIRMASADVADAPAMPFVEMVSPVGDAAKSEASAPAAKTAMAAAPKEPAATKKSADHDAIGAVIAGTRLARIDLAQGSDE